MYGWLNECIKNMIITRYGVDVWAQVKSKSGIVSDEWGVHDYYSDDVYFKLSKAAAEVVDLQESQVSALKLYCQ
jgi:hypothetical protein